MNGNINSWSLTTRAGKSSWLNLHLETFENTCFNASIINQIKSIMTLKKPRLVMPASSLCGLPIGWDHVTSRPSLTNHKAVFLYKASSVSWDETLELGIFSQLSCNHRIHPTTLLILENYVSCGGLHNTISSHSPFKYWLLIHLAMAPALPRLPWVVYLLAL